MTRRIVLAVSLAALLVLAGCSGLGGDATTADMNETDTPSSTTAPTNPAETTSSGESTSSDGATTAAGTTAPEDTETTTTDPRSEAMTDQEKQIQADTLAWLDGVDNYRVEATINQTVISGDVTQNVSTTATVRINGTARELFVNRTQTAYGQTVSQQNYLKNQTMYVHNQRFAAQYGSEWVKVDLSENFTRVWKGQDVLHVRQEVLNASSVSLVEETTLDGTPVYVVRMYPSFEDLETIEGFGINATNVNEMYGTLWVSKDDSRLLRSTMFVNQTVTNQGQEMTIVLEATRDYSAFGEPVEITLPDEAENAVNLSNQSAAVA